MRILADENMPYAVELFRQFGEVITKAGRAITADDLQDIDILLVRSITRVDSQLLAKANRLQLVGTATIGIDHLDTALLDARGIAWCNAPGCNATAVAEYVISAMLVIAERQQQPLAGKTLAIVGAGNIGSRLQKKAEALGLRTLLCDPPLQQAGDPRDFVNWNQVTEADIISLHVPITREGPHATHHLVDAALLAKLRPGTLLINSCRGDVVDNHALLNALQQGKDLQVVMDVWQNEPTVSQPLLDKVDVATPHIAGYSLEGKARGTWMLYQAWCERQALPVATPLESLLPKAAIAGMQLNGTLDAALIKRLVHGVYDIRRDDAEMRHLGRNGGGFDGLRKGYWQRREFSSMTLSGLSQADGELAKALGYKIS